MKSRRPHESSLDLPPPQPRQWDELRKVGHAQLAHRESGVWEADRLLATILKVSRSQLLAYPEREADSAIVTEFYEGLAACRRGVPLAYLLKSQGFWSLEIGVAPGVLIPRPETELLVELILRDLSPSLTYHGADLGTGSGAIALALAVERPRWRLWATELSPVALAIAQANFDAQGVADRITLLPGDFCAPLGVDRKFDFIVSNPPYLAPDDPHLPTLTHEPRLALVAENDGLASFETIARQASSRLMPHGKLWFEHGFQQGAAVRRILSVARYVAIETYCDLLGHERVTSGKLP